MMRFNTAVSLLTAFFIMVPLIFAAPSFLICVAQR